MNTNQKKNTARKTIFSYSGKKLEESNGWDTTTTNTTVTTITTSIPGTCTCPTGLK